MWLTPKTITMTSSSTFLPYSRGPQASSLSLLFALQGKGAEQAVGWSWFDLCSASGYPEYLFNCEEDLVYEGDRYDAKRMNLNGTTITGRLAPDGIGFIKESITPITDFVLYDALGRIIGVWPFQGDFNEYVYSQDLPLGIYFYTVLDKATWQVKSSGKIMIKE